MTHKRSVSALVLSACFFLLIAILDMPNSIGTTMPSRNALTAAVENSAAAANDSLVTQPDDGNATVLSMIAGASTSVDLVMYELTDTDVEKALADAEKRGVTVRVLLNQGYYGAASTADKQVVNQAAYDYLQSATVAVQWTPSTFALTHEKSMVVDNSKALIMTYNLQPKYYATSRDFGIIDSDPADITAMNTTFTNDWGNVVATAPTGDDLVWSPNSETSLVALINSATKTLDVYNEEMSDENIVKALLAAQKRGVTVRVVMTYSSQWKDELTELTSGGVGVRTYPDTKKAPVYIHAKVIIADAQNMFVGSENFSSTSLSKNRELGILISNTTIANSIELVFEKDWNTATSD
jgi:cardiolipin synthase